MNAENFCYWLQGFIELSLEGQGISPAQIKIVQDHLSLVLNKVTPKYPTTLTGALPINTPIPNLTASC